MTRFTDDRFSWTVKLMIITCLCFLASHQTNTHAAPAGVQFENRILEKVVRNALNKPQGEITIKDMASLKEISTNFDHITSLKGLEYAVNLTSLFMVNSKISDLNPISGLHQLKSIVLDDNHISDLGPLKGLNKVEHLSLSHNRINDLSPLESMISLQTLNLSINLISDIKPLKNLHLLERLDLTDNFVTSLIGVEALSKLDSLFVGGNLITNLSPVMNLQSLLLLNVSNNKVNDLKPIQQLKLLALEIVHTDITDLAPIENMNTLNVIYAKESALDKRSQAFMKQFKLNKEHYVYDYPTFSAPKIFINDEVQSFPVRPVQNNGRIIVPLRGLLEWIGADFNWNGKTRQVTLKYEGTEVILTLKSNKVIVNGKEQLIDTEPYIEDGYTMVPIRFITETFGFDLKWDSKHNWVMLSTPSPFPMESKPGTETKAVVLTKQDIYDFNLLRSDWSKKQMEELGLEKKINNPAGETYYSNDFIRYTYFDKEENPAVVHVYGGYPGPRGISVGDTFKNVLALFPQDEDWHSNSFGVFYGQFDKYKERPLGLTGYVSVDDQGDKEITFTIAESLWMRIFFKGDIVTQYTIYLFASD